MVSLSAGTLDKKKVANSSHLEKQSYGIKGGPSPTLKLFCM
jgi:hypothetical protein